MLIWMESEMKTNKFFLFNATVADQQLHFFSGKLIVIES